MSDPLYDDAHDEPLLVSIEIADDIWISELVRALTAANLTIKNIPGRGLRIVRFPAPGEET